ncbi:MAG: peptidase M48, partial [Spirulina sp.]
RDRAGGVPKYAHEFSLDEFMRQSEEYQELDRDELNQIYKFLLYNGGQGFFFSHPFTVERLHYLREWEQSEQYYQIRQGNYKNVTKEGGGNVSASNPESEIEMLQRQIRDLEEKISRVKGQSSLG